MVRSALITLGLLLTLAVPASAQELGTPLVVSTAHIKHEGARVGALTVSRDGASIVATAAFKGRPPGKTMSVCVTVAGEERTVTLETSADFTAPLSAKARSGAARGHLAL
jgi:hypothetical protein